MVNYSEVRTPITKVTDRNAVPEDALVLDREEAKNLQWELIGSWKKRTEVWPFTYGIGALSAAAGFTGYVINSHYRKKLRLHNFGLLTSYMPLVVLPALITPMFHTMLVTNKILLSEYTCPICLETRAVFIQMQCGFIYPMILAPLSAFYLAGTSLHYAIPSLKQFKAAFNLYVTSSSRIWGKAGLLAIIQAAMALGITYAEATSIDMIHDELVARHREGRQKDKEE